MERGNTKYEILDAALTLFSTGGYEATSISQIAEAVGIRKASLYSHFASKQEILDALIETIQKQYEEHSMFAQADWNNADFTANKEDMTVEQVVQMIIRHIRFILHNPQVSRIRKLLTIEQFRNEQLSQLQTKQNYSDIMNYFTGFISFLIHNGKLKDDEPEIMAAQLCLPISVWINLCDREPEREPESTDLIERHVRQFFKMYKLERV